MEKLSMCRICLSDDIPMRSIVRTPLQEVYESLTTMPFVTEDRPAVVCTLCCVRLENSLELKEKCLQSEKLFTELVINNVQINLQVMPDALLSTEGVSPNVFGNDEVKQENAEDDPAVKQALSSEWDVPLFVVKEEQDDVDTDDAAVEQDDSDPYHSALGLHTECDIPLDIVKKELDDVDTDDAAVEQGDSDPYHSALGLHTECDIPLDIVKKERDDVDTGINTHCEHGRSAPGLAGEGPLLPFLVVKPCVSTYPSQDPTPSKNLSSDDELQRTAYNRTMEKQSDKPEDFTNEPLPSMSEPKEVKDAVASTSATPFAQPIRAAPKTRAQIQREYRQRIAASRTPAQKAAARKLKNERQRINRLRQAANLTIASGFVEATTKSSSPKHRPY